MIEGRVLDLEDAEAAEKQMRKYLEDETPGYLGAKPVSLDLVLKAAWNIIDLEKKSVALVYDVKLDNGSEAFGTIGGLLYPDHPPYANVFPKSDVSNEELAARMHFYHEAGLRYQGPGGFDKASLEGLAESLEIPENLR